MINAKQTAFNLYNRFVNEVKSECLTIEDVRQRAIRCALICVNEMAAISPNNCFLIDVRSEINKL